MSGLSEARDESARGYKRKRQTEQGEERTVDPWSSHHDPGHWQRKLCRRKSGKSEALWAPKGDCSTNPGRAKFLDVKIEEDSTHRVADPVHLLRTGFLSDSLKECGDISEIMIFGTIVPPGGTFWRSTA